MVQLGFMVDIGKHDLFGGCHLYHATRKGQEAMRAESPSPPPQKPLTRSQKRYREFQNEDSGLTFFEWLREQKHRTKHHAYSE
jgi:hypothetical protein